MKRVFMVLCISLFSIGLIFAEGIENLYTLVVPDTFTSLALNGSLGSDSLMGEFNDALQIEIGTSPFSFDLDGGVNATYIYSNQTLDSNLDLNGTAALRLGTSVIGANIVANALITKYGVDFGDMKGFYAYGGNLTLRPQYFVGSTTNFYMSLTPLGIFGIGRMYNINTLKSIELMMKHLGLVPTEATVRAVADIMYTNRTRLNRYSEQSSENYVMYWKAIAEAMGVPDRVLDLLFIGNSQTYAFEQERYQNMQYGWDAGVRIEPKMVIQTGSGFDGGIKLTLFGDYGAFLMENALYLLANGTIELNYFSGNMTPLTFGISLNGNVRYLPEDYRWWVEGLLGINFDTSTTPKFDIDLGGEFDYLLAPNFRTYAGLSFVNNFDMLCFYAGGNIRLW